MKRGSHVHSFSAHLIQFFLQAIARCSVQKVAGICMLAVNFGTRVQTESTKNHIFPLTCASPLSLSFLRGPLCSEKQYVITLPHVPWGWRQAWVSHGILLGWFTGFLANTCTVYILKHWSYVLSICQRPRDVAFPYQLRHFDLAGVVLKVFQIHGQRLEALCGVHRHGLGDDGSSEFQPQPSRKPAIFKCFQGTLW